MSTLFFMHIPRTGGTTISHILNNYFRCVKVSSKELSPLKTECLHGHFRYSPNRIGTWVTFIREPKSRLISLYNYYLQYNSFSPDDFLRMVGPNPMARQMNDGNFDFVGIYEDYNNEVIRLCNFLNVEVPNIRHNHKTINKVQIDIPDYFIEKDLAIYDSLR